MSNNKIGHPLDVVSVGDIVKVYVIDIDIKKAAESRASSYLIVPEQDTVMRESAAAKILPE